MAQQRVPKPNLEKLVAAHEALHNNVERLRETIENLEDVDQLPPIIDQLDLQLESHFAWEEEGGYLGEAVGGDPRLAGLAARLRKQHPELLDAFREIRSLVADAGQPRGRIALQCFYEDYLDRFNEHEQSEERLLQDALGTDIGTKD